MAGEPDTTAEFDTEEQEQVRRCAVRARVSSFVICG